MFITVRVSLQPNTTESQAKELGRDIASAIQVEARNKLGEPIDKVYFSVDEGDGNYLGP